MKQLKITTEVRAYSENEAKSIIEEFRTEAREKGYVVGAAGYTHKEKKKKGAVVAEAWVCKLVAVYEPIWDEDEGQ